MELVEEFTATGGKILFHDDAIADLREGKAHPVVAHVLPTNVCQHDCRWCSVSERSAESLKLAEITGFLDQLTPIGLKAVIVSGGGNPVLYPDFNEMIAEISARGLEIGLICNGMPLADFGGRLSWKNVPPGTLDKLTWCRISMSGLDHVEKCVYVPDFDQSKTTLGFSYVFDGDTERLPWLRVKMRDLIAKHNPRYVRLLPNCLEHDKIEARCAELREFSKSVDETVCFVQYKPPKAPPACYLGYIHPVLDASGWVFPCDSCVLNKGANHKFAEPWRMCRWDQIGEFYKRPVHSLIADPRKQCEGCVFSKNNAVLGGIVHGLEFKAPTGTPEHANFV